MSAAEEMSTTGGLVDLAWPNQAPDCVKTPAVGLSRFRQPPAFPETLPSTEEHLSRRCTRDHPVNQPDSAKGGEQPRHLYTLQAVSSHTAPWLNHTSHTV